MESLFAFRLLSVLTVSTLGLVSNASGGLVLEDDFNDGVIDVSKWEQNLDPPGSSLAESGGVLTTTGRGALFSQDSFSGPLEINGTVSLTDGFEHFNVAARSDGNVISGNSFYEKSGIIFSFSNDGDQISIQEMRSDGTITILSVKSYSLVTSTPYSFTATLDGASLALAVNGIQELTATSSYSAGGRVGFYSREGSSRSSSVDYFSVAAIPEPTSSFVLLGLVTSAFFRRRRRLVK